MSETVWEWMGITKEEFYKRTSPGTCVKCGKKTINNSDNLCKGHKIAYHRWVNNQRKRYKVFVVIVEADSEMEKEIQESREVANWYSSGKLKLKTARELSEKIDEVDFPEE